MIPKGTVKRIMKDNTEMYVSTESVVALVDILQEMIVTTTKIAEENAAKDKRKTIKARDIEECDAERLKEKILQVSERTEKVNMLANEILHVIASELERY
ncbi:histone family protein [Methanococcus voltae]|uniref:DNA-binding protein HmvA n=3 Tax=Methanococcus voltae TaxID=2188 RepID=HMVA_METVO|nr:histone [Methanococcus voltae]Q03576.1 RecName: Full=DNA-binding protein HmvA [Methanococcus voltae]MBP2171925.1 histone H3/H4 [Methanococcus voltae]MBP2201120.1 histone H3/H4 [Methanococcus voltae]MCS3921843.1 histone H3/H4 [Methanococcus voltae PS]CAA49447.1 histon like protein [Methanococcus voltae PS]